MKYVTQERENWRKDIRNELENLSKVRNTYEFQKFYVFMQVRLNPDDKKDKEILYSIDCLINCPTCDKEWRALTEKIAKLLKHDWERVKKEVGLPNITLNFIKVLLFSGLFFLFISFIHYPGNGNISHHSFFSQLVFTITLSDIGRFFIASAIFLLIVKYLCGVLEFKLKEYIKEIYGEDNRYSFIIKYLSDYFNIRR